MPHRDKDRREVVRSRASSIADIGAMLDKMFFIMGCDYNDYESMLAARTRFQYLEQLQNRESWFKRTTTGLIVTIIFAFILSKLGFSNVKVPPL